MAFRIKPDIGQRIIINNYRSVFSDVHTKPHAVNRLDRVIQPVTQWLICIH